MPNDFKPIIGYKFQFETTPKVKFGSYGRIFCEVLEIIPYKKLAYSWKANLSKENPVLDSTIVWTLEATRKGSILTLEHKGFRGIKSYLSYIITNKGWVKIAKRLIKQLNSILAWQHKHKIHSRLSAIQTD